MPASLTATEVAFLMVALVQGVFALVWAIGACMVPTARRAVAHWVVWAALSCVTWLILSAKVQSLPLIGVLLGVLGVMALQRGIRLFIGRKLPDRRHIVLLLVVISGSLLVPDAELRHVQAAINYGVLAWLNFEISRDLYLHARDDLRFRWPALLALPMVIGSASYAARVLQATVDPASVATEMAADSALNVRAALIFVALVLTLHATLMALVVGRLVRELRKQSRHDGLTGLLNRRAMEEVLQAQIQRSRRTRESFAVMMLDLDHFKRINDRYGHAVGDLALKHVSGLLNDAMRGTDRLSRFGGEEFVVLMPGITLDQAQISAERLRDILNQAPLKCDSEIIALSTSIGVAQWSDEDASNLLCRADAALFRAKDQGRNRVIVASEAALSSEPLLA